MNEQPRTRLKIRWPDLWAMVGLSAAAVLIVAAMFYGYNL